MARVCDICGGEGLQGRARHHRPVVTFHLESVPPGPRGRGKRAGEISLCEKCWLNLANPVRHLGEVVA